MSNAFRCINLVRLKIISNIIHSCISCVQKKSFIIPCVINVYKRPSATGQCVYLPTQYQ